ncbi:MAG: prolipoprotein diacylglyceryl transferase [candidate division KSB1 bacterium]|nr:prolipoprotein diacylglyceryl transferase [candidate division KSB1 bacterium]
MYEIAFVVVYGLTLYRLKREPLPFAQSTIDAFFGWAIAGILIGGRLGYVLFYEPMMMIENPVAIFCRSIGETACGSQVSAACPFMAG